MNVGTSVVFAAACSALVLGTSAASAATCADRTFVIDRLNDRFGEDLFGNALSPTGEVLEIYANPANQSWTILVSLPDRDLSCLIAAGTGTTRLNAQLASLGN